MDETLKQILISSIPAAIVGYFTFRWKQKVINEFDQENIKLKSELDRFVNESNVRFSQAYSIKTLAIRDLYKKLVQAEYDTTLYTTPHRPSNDYIEELYSNFKKSNDDFYHFFKQNEILFDGDVCCLIEKIQKLFIDTSRNIHFMDAKPDIISREERISYWKNYDQNFGEVIPLIKEKLKTSFRAELGIK